MSTTLRQVCVTGFACHKYQKIKQLHDGFGWCPSGLHGSWPRGGQPNRAYYLEDRHVGRVGAEPAVDAAINIAWSILSASD